MDRIVFDAAPSVRSFDDNGFMHVAVSNLTKETVNPYRGREIPGWQERGLAPERVYYGYRAGSELEKGARTFSGLPLLLDHHMEDAEAPQKNFRIGTVGTDARWESPYVKAALVVTDADAIRAIEDGSMRELSCAYRYDPLWKAGTFGGKDYDFVMTNIRGNHVALVKEGRAGSDVVVADAKSGMPETQSALEDSMMKLFDKRFQGAYDADADTEPKEGVPGQGADPEVSDAADDEGNTESVKEALISLIKGLSPEELNALADAFGAVSGDADMDEEGAEDEDEEESAAEDEDEEDAPAEDEDEEVPAEDEDEEEVPAEDEDEEDAPAEDEDEEGGCGASDAAFDAAIQEVFAYAVKAAERRTVKRFRALSEAAEAVRPVLGAIDPLAFDSASGIYGAALRRLGVDVRRHPRSAWKSMYAAVRKSAQMAQDAAYKAPLPKGFEGHFEGLNRIKRG